VLTQIKIRKKRLLSSKQL